LGPLAGTTRTDEAWSVVLAAAAEAERLAQAAQIAAFALGDDGGLRRVADGERDAIVVWRPGEGWSVALPPGDHEYMFVVDGRFVPDPEAAERRPDGFGNENTILRL